MNEKEIARIILVLVDKGYGSDSINKDNDYFSNEDDETIEKAHYIYELLIRHGELRFRQQYIN